MDGEPRFLTRELIDLLHRESLMQYGGSEGVRDQGGLESAIDAPKNIHLYESGDIYEIAAGYAFHIAEAQAFVDGNKRTGIAAALIFLDIHGCEVFRRPRNFLSVKVVSDFC